MRRRYDNEEKDKCENRIDSELGDRINDFKLVLVKYKKSKTGKIKMDGNEYEDIIDWLNQYALAYCDDPHERAKRLELSYGGP